MPEIEHVSKNAMFGKYDIGKLLGCGAFAKVYHARNVQTGQSVAVKVINKEKVFNNPTLVNNIKREISIMRRLNHPNIVKLHEVLATKSKIYFVMEFVKGGELFSKIAKGKFSEDSSRKYFQELISAVGYCHARGIYHRDLKPENLLIDEHGFLKVTDFGLSAVTCQIRADGLLHTLCGTPAYVAPEILTKKGYDGARIDVWSCGVILFVLNAGYLPFNDPNLMSMYRKIYSGEYKCPKHMSVDLKRFLSRMLDTNPETRITIDGILQDSWFQKGCKEIKFHDDDFDVKVEKDEEMKSKSLNAFDIISFSSGLDLSGLFDQSYNNADDRQRFVSSETPEKLLEKMEEFGKVENLRVKKKKNDWGLELEWQKEELVVGVEVYQLMENLFVVEAKRRSGDGSAFKDMWNNKLKPLLNVSGASCSSSSSSSETSL